MSRPIEDALDELPNDPFFNNLLSQLRKAAYRFYNARLVLTGDLKETILEEMKEPDSEYDLLESQVISQCVEDTVFIVAQWLMKYRMPQEEIEIDSMALDYEEMMHLIGVHALKDWKNSNAHNLHD